MQNRTKRTFHLIVAGWLVLVLAACSGSAANVAPQTEEAYAPQAGAPDASNSRAPQALPPIAATAALDAVGAMPAAEAEAVTGGAPPVDGMSQPVAGEPGGTLPTTVPVAISPYTLTVDDNRSTFALDVDTASYSAARNYLTSGSWPPAELVRVEEFVNAFDYSYPQPEAGTFAISVDSAPSPFGAAGRQIVRVGIQGQAIDTSERNDAVLTFVIDVSGSMADANRLPLVKQSLQMLLDELRPSDRVAIVVYGDEARVVLEHTGLDERARIGAAIDDLTNQGSTNAEAGLRLGYELAGRAFQRGANNRVILLSDGVANVGATGPEAILRAIRDYAAQGIYLTTVGFGMGDYNDYLMEQLANDGNGNYAYVDTLSAARRVFVENLTGTLQVIAKDAKVQVEFNPAVVAQYRLLGYDNRAVADADFRNDAVDAGEIGAGHSVTALYEVVLTEQGQGDALTVMLRWADPASGAVSEIATPFTSQQFGADFAAATPELRLAVAVAGFAEVLRASPYAAEWTLDEIAQVATGVAAELGNDQAVQDFAQLVSQAR